MGRLVGITAIAAAIGLGLAACGGDTTTVVNNTTTVPAEASDSTTTTVDVRDGYCGPQSPSGAGVYNVETWEVDCDEGQKLAEQWYADCLGSPSAACPVGDMTCIVSTRQGTAQVAVYCKPGVSSDREVRFQFANDP